MKRLIEFPLEEGGSIVVEVDEPAPEGGVVRAARPGEVAEKARETFDAALERIKPVAGTVIAKLRGLHRFHLLLQHALTARPQAMLKRLLETEKPPEQVQWIVDIDPLDML